MLWPMLTPVRLVLALSLGLVVACGQDYDPDETGSESSTANSTDTTGDGTTDTGSEPIPCGDIECAPDQACLTFPQEPACSDNPDEEPCPPGTTAAQCGGAGLPCCCEPPPPPVTECVDPACDGPVDCNCLVDVCVPTCTPSATAGVFICEPPPAP